MRTPPQTPNKRHARTVGGPDERAVGSRAVLARAAATSSLTSAWLHLAACARLRMISPMPKKAETDSTCTRHVDLLLESHPLSGTPTLEPFRQWCLSTAKGPILSRLLKLLCFDLPRARGGFGRR